MRRRRSRWVKARRRVVRTAEAVRRDSADWGEGLGFESDSVGADEESVFEKKTRAVSSMGWKTMRATSEP